MSTKFGEEMTQFPAPPTRKDGVHRYSPIPQSDTYNPAPPSYAPAGPTGYSQPPPHQPYPAMTGGYAPAPPVMQQQSTSNVVVVGQPTAAPTAIVVEARPRAATYLTLTLVMMVLCFIHGNLLAFICLIPALIFAIVASNHNDDGSFHEAKRCGQIALCCNVAMFVKYGLLLLVGIILVIVYFTVGFSFLKHTIDDINDGININCDTECDIFGNNCELVCN